MKAGALPAADKPVETFDAVTGQKVVWYVSAKAAAKTNGFLLSTVEDACRKPGGGKAGAFSFRYADPSSASSPSSSYSSSSSASSPSSSSSSSSNASSSTSSQQQKKKKPVKGGNSKHDAIDLTD